MSRLRLDDALVARGLYPSRARARDAVKRGTISVDGVIATKPAQSVGDETEIAVADPARKYVSRAALKLIAGLDHFALSPETLDCLDIGASTGGFTQVLIERRARHVTAIDAGHGQLAAPLRDDPRITLIEGLNARDLGQAHLATAPDFIVCDVSFIPLTLALPPALALAKPGAKLVALIKPQFEAGREAIGRGGLVSDRATHEAVTRAIARFLEARSWQVKGVIPSPIEGGEGNREFLIAAELPC